MALISGAFLASSLTVIVTPGPDAALIARFVMGSSRRDQALLAAAGMITAGGLQAGTSILGLALLLRAAALLQALRWLGAALLAWWGVRAIEDALRPKQRAEREFRSVAGVGPDQVLVPSTSWPRSFVRGFLCTGTNPKVGLFLLAFLPQFVPPNMSAAHAMAILAAVYLSLGLTWLVILIELLFRFRQVLERRRVDRWRDLHRWFDAAIGIVFISFAVRLVFGS